ncbi:hypothetical protein CEP54_012083 [Fusarium duplospermum]|uniref:Uncharacterized protein n=1 Tax=Fusarium duplospermum TaxID=1325734 RepID=A0A428PAX4_9HYPO|nr:hypothetical protein CEP54_012083 [Fusarium duplospermum]
MKATAAITILAIAANTVMAVPVAPREEAGIFDFVKTGVDTAAGLFGTGVNAAGSLFGLAFDGATCAFTGFFGVRRPTCQGRAILGNNGRITTTTTTTKGDTKGNTNTNTNTNISHESNNDSFSFSYSTEEDGRLKVTITPDAKGKAQCITIVKKEGEIKDIISREANKCL